MISVYTTRDRVRIWEVLPWHFAHLPTTPTPHSPGHAAPSYSHALPPFLPRAAGEAPLGGRRKLRRLRRRCHSRCRFTARRGRTRITGCPTPTTRICWSISTAKTSTPMASWATPSNSVPFCPLRWKHGYRPPFPLPLNVGVPGWFPPQTPFFLFVLFIYEKSKVNIWNYQYRLT